MRYVLVDGVEIKVFDTLDELGCYIEPPEVIEGLFKVFDSAGCKYILNADIALSGGFLGVFKTKTEYVKITKGTQQGGDTVELKKHLAEYLDIVKKAYDETMTIDELIDLAE